MKKVGITGSLASGKSTASKLLSKGRGPLFSADSTVTKIYQDKNLKKIILKKLKIRDSFNLKNKIKQRIEQDKFFIKKLEKAIHPLVRKEMYKFVKKNKKKNFVFFEIPLLVESRLMKFFDIIFFIKAKKTLRLQRFKLKGGNKKIFNILNKKQLSDTAKIKFSDHVVVNEKNISVLKKNILDIFRKNYE